MLGDFEDDSLSEGSAVSNGDDEAELEGSESSGDERDPSRTAAASASAVPKQKQQKSPLAPVKEAPKSGHDAFEPSADTQAMLHGVGQAQQTQEPEQLHFDTLPASTGVDTAPAEIIPPKAPRNENPAQRARREHQEYLRQRDANPAFVPNRGGFYFHDNRNSTSTAPNGRPLGRGRGRGYGPPINTG